MACECLERFLLLPWEAACLFDDAPCSAGNEKAAHMGGLLKLT